MASVSSDSHLENEDAKRKTVLEEKSKEDLIKIVKKQLALLQKAKGKTDELNQKCAALEEDKKYFQDKQSSTIIGLQQQVENLEIRFSDLIEERNKIKEEKNYEIQQLEERLKYVETEKNKYFASLNENEERLQCLSMQLNTMKETCHCFQNELTKLQETKLGLEAEIIVLTEARDAALKSLKTQNLLLDSKNSESEDLKKKYTICIEENCAITSTIENLETEMKNLQDENSNLLDKIENFVSSSETSDNSCRTNMDDFTFLIADNQKLQSEVNLLTKENSSLKLNMHSIEAFGNKNVNENVTVSDKSLEMKEMSDIRKEHRALQMSFIDAQSTSSKLRSAYEDLENENKSTLKKLHNLEEENLKANLELQSAFKENSELKEEVKRMAHSLQECSDFKTGYEYALLQGATTESLPLSYNESKNVNLEKNSSELPTEGNKKSKIDNQYFEMGFSEPMSGFEFGLLEGGDVSDMFPKSERGDVNTDSALEKHLSNKSEVSETGLIIKNQQYDVEIGESKEMELNSLLEKLRMEKDSLTKEIEKRESTCKEYAALVEETISENESLKIKIAVFEREKHMGFQAIHNSTNTTIEMVEESFHEEKVSEVKRELGALILNLEEQKLNLNEKLLSLETEKSEYLNKCNSLMEELELLKIETQTEKNDLADKIARMEETCNEYAALIEETLSKLKIKNYENEKCMQSDYSDLASQDTHTSTNTKVKNLDKRVGKIWTLQDPELLEKMTQIRSDFHENLSNYASYVEDEISEHRNKCHSLTNEIELLKSENENFKIDIKNLELLKENFEQNSILLEKQNYELSEKCESRCTELDDINFQIEILVLGIKQGVRLKTVNPNKAEKPLHENISLLKTLVEDLVILSNTNAIKIKDVKSDLEDLFVQKQALEDELFQMGELNQFLEDEAKELRTEVEQLKISQNLIDVYHRGKSPELYSIEEIDEKSISADAIDGIEAISAMPSTFVSESTNNDNVSKESINFEKTTSIIDVSVQHSLGPSAIVSEKETSDIVDYKSLVEELKMEKSNLKSSLDIKSKLVDGIHCQMDSLLEKVETANLELKNKTDDLKNSQGLVAKLQERIHELEFAFTSNQEIVTQIKDTVSELKAEKDNIKTDISCLNEFSVNMLHNISHSTIETVNKIQDICEHSKSKNKHLENIITHVHSHLGRFVKNLELWLINIKGMHETESKSGECEAQNVTFETVNKACTDLSYSVLSETECDNDCCSLKKNVAQLYSTAQQFSCVMNNFNPSYFSSILKELDSHKTIIVPNLEIKIRSLESKLDEYLNKKEIEETPQEKTVEKGTKETSEVDFKSQLADTEVKMNKFKQIALKLKKELVETKKQINEVTNEKEKYVLKLNEVQKELEKISSERILSVQNYQSLQNEYDKIQDDLDLQKENGKGLEGDLSATLHELNSFREKISDMETQLLKANQMIDSITLAKQDKEKAFVDLESKLIITESKKQEKLLKIEELEASIKQKVENMNVLSAENSNLKKQLDHLLKEGKKSNLLDLEMADYEKSIQELNNKILKKDEDIEELNENLNSEIEKNKSLLEEIKFTETIKSTEEKRAESLKEALEKTKSELIAIKERKAELLDSVSSLQMQLEIITQQEENCKLQLSETSSEVLHLKEMLKTSSENQQRIVRSLESKISSQKQEISFAHKEVEDIKQEFENYKIRVHSVLKQQKSSTPTLVSVDDDLKEKLETMVDKLKMQVKDLSEKLKALSMEYEALQDEHDILLKRHSKFIEDREKKDSEWFSRLEQINSEKSKLRAAQEEQSSQHMLQNEMLVATYKKQIKIMSDEHKRTVNELQKQLESADMEISRLQRDQQKSQGLPPTPTFQDNSLTFDILSQERQEGEGSESIEDLDTPIRHLSLATIPTSGFLPFEKLLQSPAETGTPTNFIRYQDCEKMLADLNAVNKQIEHLSGVLNDSESTNLRLSEQVRVLKEEVRRLERNKEREKHAENLEYLKNVIIKFATLGAGSEKAMLIPVLTTMLELSPAEQQQLKSIAGDIDPNEASSSGWGSYLHRWSGLA